MKTDERILSEIKRYNSINNYIMEQDALDAPDLGAEPTPAPDLGGAPADAPVATPADTTPTVIDVETDTDVEKIDNKGETEKTESGTEELDITDLVDSQKKIENKQEEYFQNLFGQLENLQSKLGEMDGLVQKLNDIEAKLEKYRQKSPEEKLELRTLDSGPYNQKLTDYFSDKLPEMEKQGKEYVLTTDDVQSFSPNEIKKTFAAELPSMNTRNYNN
jgi:hypothetical protein